MRPKEFQQERTRGVTGSELTASLAATLGQCLCRHGIGMAHSDEIALEVLGVLRQTYGGQNVYIPLERLAEISSRDTEIYARFSSNELTIPDIAQVYGISLQWAYHIIRTVRARQVNERAAEREAQRATALTQWKRER